MAKLYSQKHYIDLARFFNFELSVATEVGIALDDSERARHLRGVARLLATHFEHDNPKFDRKKFLAAVGFGA